MKRLHLWSSCIILLVLFLTACGTSGAPAGSQEVQITESDFQITSSASTFTSGTTYHFVVKNDGKVAHEFMIMPKDEGTMGGMGMGDMDMMALAKIASINPGETKTLDYIFPDSTKGSQPQLACYTSGHYEAGMKLNVHVNS